MSITLETEYVPVNCGPKDSGGCGLPFAMTRQFYDLTRRTGEGWYCPNGHRRYWGGKTTERELEDAALRETQLKDQLRAAVQDAEQTRIALLRDRHRFANGVCPCCNRSFENVARHIRGQHPDYDITKVRQQAIQSFTCSCGRAFESLRGLRTHQGSQRLPGWDTPGRSRFVAHLTRV